MRPNQYTDHEIQIIREMYPDHYSIEVAERLGRPLDSVYRKAAALRVKKSEAFVLRELKTRQAERLRIVGEHARFQKGALPHNKGIKMSEELYEKCKSTMFKKGIIPPNKKPEGSERYDQEGFTLVKVGAKYVHKHRHIYEQEHEIEIPGGYVVAFADGNKQNFDISNLVLITRAENMIRNTIHRYPKELKSIIRLTSKLKKIIHEKQN